MNFFPMNAGGGKLEETVLWTNSSPTSSFGNTNISLSNNIADYDYLRIYYRTSTSIDTSSYVDVPVAEFINKSSVSTNTPMWTLEALVNNAYTLAQRTITYSSSNVIQVSGCSLINYGNNTITNSQNTYAIPTKVSGLKKSASGGGVVPQPTETSLWTNSSPTSSFSAQTVTLSDSIDRYDYIKVKYRYATYNDLVMVDILPVSEFKKYQVNSAQSGSGILGMISASNAEFSRDYYYASSTSVQFKSAYTVGSSSSDNDLVIPLEIIGMKGVKSKEVFHFRIGSLKSTKAVFQWYKNANGDNNFSKLRFEGTSGGFSSLTYQLQSSNGTWGTTTTWSLNQEVDLSDYIGIEVVLSATSSGTGYADLVAYD